MRTPLPVALAFVALIGLLAACNQREEQRKYSVRAEVVRLVDGGRELVLNHEAVPGWMAAMQMTIAVQDANASKGLVPGDKIRFDLHVAGSQAQIGAIEKLPADTPLELAAPTGA